MSNIFLTFDKVTVEGVNLKQFSKAHSKLDSNYNNSAKKDLKDIVKGLNNVDKWIKALSTLSKSGSEYATRSFNMEDWGERRELAEAVGLEDRVLIYAIGGATYFAEPEKTIFTVDELILACNTYAEELEKRIAKYRSQVEKELSDEDRTVHLTFSKYCYIDVKGAAAKKVYEILSDRVDHTLVFTLDDVKAADDLYRLKLTAIDVEEI